MKDGIIKRAVRSLLFPEGSVRKIVLGPMRGFVFRVGPITGLSPLYSGTERDHQRLFRQLVRPGSFVLDVGANWGIHTLYLSKIVGDTGQVLAFEPFPPAFSELNWHLAANRCMNVRHFQMALSNHTGKSSFATGDSAATGKLASNGSATTMQRTIQVTVQTLDCFVEQTGLRRMDFIKIDVEGAESLVLEGGEKALSQFRPTLVIDLHTPEQDVRVAKWLTHKGYRLRRVNGPPILQLDRGWPEKTGVWGSILAVPE